MNLLRLSSLAGEEGLRERGRRAIAAFRGRWEEAPHAMPQLLCALEPALEAPRHVVITGDPGSPGFAALVSVVHGSLGPSRALIAPDGSPSARAWFTARLPWISGMGSGEAGPAAYVCEEFACRAPARTAGELREALGRPPEGA
jgi:hypothetical protein